MTNLVKLWDEKTLIANLQDDTLSLIRGCKTIPPIKKLIECYEILDLTLEIQNQFPTVWPDLPICDSDALIHLENLIRELAIYHRAELPHPDFDIYNYKIKHLLRLFQVPKEEP